jgi:hypothetical protein
MPKIDNRLVKNTAIKIKRCISFVNGIFYEMPLLIYLFSGKRLISVTQRMLFRNQAQKISGLALCPGNL